MIAATPSRANSAPSRPASARGWTFEQLPAHARRPGGRTITSVAGHRAGIPGGLKYAAGLADSGTRAISLSHVDGIPPPYSPGPASGGAPASLRDLATANLVARFKAPRGET
jgi:hypothetical protein